MFYTFRGGISTILDSLSRSLSRIRERERGRGRGKFYFSKSMERMDWMVIRKLPGLVVFDNLWKAVRGGRSEKYGQNEDVCTIEMGSYDHGVAR